MVAAYKTAGIRSAACLVAGQVEVRPSASLPRDPGDRAVCIRCGKPLEVGRLLAGSPDGLPSFWTGDRQCRLIVLDRTLASLESFSCFPAELDMRVGNTEPVSAEAGSRWVNHRAEECFVPRLSEEASRDGFEAFPHGNLPGGSAMGGKNIFLSAVR